MDYADLLRLPFKDGGRSPEEGFDCWGLVKYVLEAMGRTDVPDFAYGTALDASDIGGLIAR
ncbi:MAG: C40 family peptidase, partial [Proteobacteria bacterium]|nr:C40 family peptidase [Pseudomonadota bacterium]